MPCYGPLTAYRPAEGAPDKRLVFRKDKSSTGVAIKVPCGKCSGCKLEHSRQWAVRCMHEKRLHNASSFVTLTYDPAHLPSGLSLVKADLQNFMKRYRNYAGDGVRFFACGEYGEKTLRPHYHILLLNRDIPDIKYYKMSGENRLYTSSLLDNIWGKGLTVVGDVTFESAAYVARYCMKKITGPKAAAHYGSREPEFITMSRRPGIGAGYFDKYKSEILDHDNIIVNGVPAALPRFYDGKIENIFASDDNIGLYSRMELLKLKRRRKISQSARADARSSRRRRAKEVVTLAKLAQKGRSI